MLLHTLHPLCIGIPTFFLNMQPDYPFQQSDSSFTSVLVSSFSSSTATLTWARRDDDVKHQSLISTHISAFLHAHMQPASSQTKKMNAFKLNFFKKKKQSLEYVGEEAEICFLSFLAACRRSSNSRAAQRYWLLLYHTTPVPPVISVVVVNLIARASLWLLLLWMRISSLYTHLLSFYLLHSCIPTQSSSASSSSLPWSSDWLQHHFTVLRQNHYYTIFCFSSPVCSPSVYFVCIPTK